MMRRLGALERLLFASLLVAMLLVLLLLSQSTISVALVCLAAALGLVHAGVIVHRRRLVARMERLAAICAQVSRGDDSQRVEETGRDELALVARGINSLIDRLSKERDDLERCVAQRTEQLQQALDRAKRIMATRGNSLAVVTHEVRTPMNAVLGASELLLETDLDDHQRELMQTVRSSGGLLLELINDVLDFSKIEAGRIEFEQIPFDVESELEAVLRAFEDMARSQGLYLRMECETNLDPLVVGDSLRLRQVVMNLVSNAVKFTATGGVMVRVRRHPGPGSKIEFEVEDTGIGIPVTALPRLFRAFTQADSSTTREYGGTGLGLAICKQLVEAMGGHIDVESQHGVGSLFRFTVELQGLSQEDRFAFAVASGLQGLSVLVIGDVHEFMQWIGRVLACYQVEARWALPEAALAALDVGGSGQPDIIIVAVQSLGDQESLARLLARAHIPMLVLGGTSLETGSASISRRLPERPRRQALIECLSELASGRHGSGARCEEAHHGLRVLLADDNLANQKVAEAMLRQLGCDVVIADDGVRAVEAHASAVFDIILMDYQMPRLDGPAATRRIRADESVQGRARTPIVAVTANAGGRFEASCKAAGMDGFLTKPIRKADLRRILDRLASGALLT